GFERNCLTADLVEQSLTVTELSPGWPNSHRCSRSANLPTQGASLASVECDRNGFAARETLAAPSLLFKNCSPRASRPGHQRFTGEAAELGQIAQIVAPARG